VNEEAQPTSRYLWILVLMVLAYMLVIRSMYGWLWDVNRGQSFFFSAIYSQYRVIRILGEGLPTSAGAFAKVIAPYLVVGLCVVGLLKRRPWAWWLTVVACAYSLVFTVTGLQRTLLVGGTHLVSSLVNLAWLLAIVGLLLAVRRAGDIPPKLAAD
jgi:hypothetical protein